MPKRRTANIKEFDENNEVSDSESSETDNEDKPAELSKSMVRKKVKRMRKREVRKIMMIYPEDEWKGNWDLFVTMILIFTCLTTPYLISFDGADSFHWKIINYTIDSFFLIDIIFNFN